jgi:hypothetical protein
MTGQEKDDLLIQVTAWAGLTVYAHAHITPSHCTEYEHKI